MTKMGLSQKYKVDAMFSDERGSLIDADNNWKS